MPTSSGNDGLQNLQAQQQRALTTGGNAIEGQFARFDPTFYQNAGKAFSNYALPQVDQQYRNTSKQLGFNMANRGLVNSSAGRELGTSLTSELAKAQSQVGNQSQQFVQDLQGRVAGQKSALYGQLQSSLNPTTTAQAAANAAAQTAAPSQFAPIGNLFNNWATQYLSQQTANTYNPMLMMPYMNQRSGFAALPNNR